MSLSLFVQTHQFFGLLFNAYRVFDDEIQKARHLRNDLRSCVFGVMDKAFVNSIVTKMTASVSGIGQRFWKPERVNPVSQYSTLYAPVFAETLKRKPKQSRGRCRRVVCNALSFIENLFNAFGHELRGHHGFFLRPHALLINPKTKLSAIYTAHDANLLKRIERGERFDINHPVVCVFAVKIHAWFRGFKTQGDRNRNLLSEHAAVTAGKSYVVGRVF